MKYLKLYESYQSQKDLEGLVKSILRMIAEKTLDKLESNISKIHDFESIYFKDINPNAFGVLAGFIKDFNNLELHIVTKAELSKYSNGNASYLTVDGDTQRIIMLTEDDYTIERANKYVANWNYDNTEEVVTDISDVLHAKYKNHLIHELQHAYDDWRSGGKFAHEPEDYLKDRSRFNELNSRDMSTLKDEELAFIGKHHIDYLNFKHEVDARFTDAIAKTDFYEWDIDASFEADRDILAMKPFPEVLKRFKANIYPFIHLNDENKKRVLRKLGQFYELEKEFVKQKNEETK